MHAFPVEKMAEAPLFDSGRSKVRQSPGGWVYMAVSKGTFDAVQLGLVSFGQIQDFIAVS